MIHALGIKKTAILLLSMTVLMTSVFLTQEAFAGDTTCEGCRAQLQDCLDLADSPSEVQQCRDQFQGCLLVAVDCAVGGDMIQMETTSILAAGAQYTAAWMIPVLVSAIGIGIVIARKF